VHDGQVYVYHLCLKKIFIYLEKSRINLNDAGKDIIFLPISLALVMKK